MEASLIPNHKYIIQSYIFTTARYNYSLYEKRILYRLVEYAQEEIEGIKIKDHLNRIRHNLNDVSISMPISSVLINSENTDYNKHYDEAKKACKALGRKYFEFQDVERQEYWGDNIIYNINIKKREGVMHFNVVNWIWDAILDFSKGFRKFDLAIAIRLKSTYSMRFYELLSGQSKPIEYSISELRKMFCVEDKYKLTADFQKRIIISSQKELNGISPYSFEFVPNFVGIKIVSYTFYPVFIAANQDEKVVQMEQMAKVTARLQLDQHVYDYLRYSFGFTTDEINKNKKTLIDGQKKIGNYIDFLASLRKNAQSSYNPKGYIIAAIKRTLASAEGVKDAKRKGSVFASSPTSLTDKIRQLVIPGFNPK